MCARPSSVWENKIYFVPAGFIVCAPYYNMGANSFATHIYLPSPVMNSLSAVFLEIRDSDWPPPKR